MNRRRFILRSLFHYRKTALAIASGIMVATAVLTGSLLVGDSMTDTLRNNALSRLGGIDYALLSPHFFSDTLIKQIVSDPTLAGSTIQPAILTRASAQRSDSSILLPNINVIGIDPQFWQFFPNSPSHTLSKRQIAVNQSLARDLHLEVGNTLLLNIDRPSLLSDQMLFAHRRRDDTLRTLRLEVALILPDAGPGVFSLNSSTSTPRNVFISRSWLADALQTPAQSNAILFHSIPSPIPFQGIAQCSVDTHAALADLGLSWTPQSDTIAYLHSDRLLLRTHELSAANDAAQQLNATLATNSIYLATTLRKTTSNPRSISYSLIAGVHSLVPAKYIAGQPGPIEKNSIILNQWAAEDLNASPGDPIELTCLIPSPDGTYCEKKIPLTLQGIVELSAAPAEQAIVPDLQGITGAKRIDDWDAPFPLDLKKVTQRDDEYWDRYHATPKAFISPALMRSIWSAAAPHDGPDWTTGIRIVGPASSIKNFPAALLDHLSPAQFGLSIRPVRQLALESASGSTDFSSLFLAMSMFLIVAAMALSGTLMRLMAERRATEVGLMLASGIRPRTANLIVIAEGAAISSLGVLLGLPLGLLYGWTIIKAFSHWWLAPWGNPALAFSVYPSTLLYSALAGLIVGILCATWGVLALRRRNTLQLLAGWQAAAIRPSINKIRAASIALAGLLLIAGTLILSSLTGNNIPPQSAFFGSGACLLLASLCACYIALTSAMRYAHQDRLSLSRIALRSAAANPGRSLLAIGLFASASFILVAVAANRRDYSRFDVTQLQSGAGGFNLRLTSSLPFHYDLNTPAGRSHLGFSPDDESAFQDTTLLPMLLSPGDDISCLNLAKPLQPRLLGVSPALIQRGGFNVQPASPSKNENPWTLLDQPPDADDAIPVFGDADSIQWILHSGPNQILPFTAPSGATLKLRIVGTIPSSIFAGQLLLSQSNFHRIYPDITSPRYFLLSTPPANQSHLVDLLRSNLGELGLEVQPTSEILNSLISVQNIYMSIFLALGGLGVLLGTVGLLAVLFRNAFERQHELAFMLITGLHRKHLIHLMVIENAGLLLIGLLAGTLSALVAVAPAFSSELTHINYPAILLLLFSVLLFALITCHLAARLASRLNFLPALHAD